MARTYSAPGIYKQEIDLSEILVPTGISNGGIVVKAKKGPINRLVLISNDKEYIDTFGQPIYTSGYSSGSEADRLTPDYGYGAYAALEFLKESSTLYVVRGFDKSEDKYAGIKVDNDASNLSSASAGGISATAYTQGVRLDSKTYIRAIDEFAASDNGKDYFTIAALGPGTDGNSIAVVIEPFSPSADWRYSYDEYPTNSVDTQQSVISSESLSAYPIAKNIFKLNIYTKSTLLTGWDQLYRNSNDRGESALYINPVETFYGSFNKELKDANQKSLFIETVVNGNSKYVFVKNGTNGSELIPTISGANDNANSNFKKYYPYGLSGTDEYVKYGRLFQLADGDSPSTAADDDAASWKIFQDRENVDVQILIGTSNGNATFVALPFDVPIRI